MVTNKHPVHILRSPDGEPTALHDFGGEGPALLLGHGNGLNAGMWVAAVPFLRGHFHCYGVDLRGHGASRPENRAYSVVREHFGDDILTCIDAIDDAPVRYAGHSLGAASAVVAALKRPEAFVGLWLFEPVIVPDDFERPSAPSMLIEAARRRRMTFDSVDDAIERFSSKLPFAGCDPVAVRAYVEIGSYPVEEGIRLSCEGVDEARVFESSQPTDFSRLAALTMPIVVAAGGEEVEVHAIPARVAPLVAKALANATFEVFPTLTHFGPLEAPEMIAQSVIAHFDRIVREGSEV